MKLNLLNIASGKIERIHFQRSVAKCTITNVQETIRYRRRHLFSIILRERERVAEDSWYDCGSIHICQNYVAITNKLVSKSITTVQGSSILIDYPGLVSDKVKFTKCQHTFRCIKKNNDSILGENIGKYMETIKL